MCSRPLKNQQSIERGMGPQCWAKGKGDIFEQDLTADDAEWERREKLLRSGGESDLGCNWQYVDYNPDMALQIPGTARVSVGHNPILALFEVRVHKFGVHGPDEYSVEFASSNIRATWQAAVRQGPELEASVHQYQRNWRQHLRRMARKGTRPKK